MQYPRRSLVLSFRVAAFLGGLCALLALPNASRAQASAPVSPKETRGVWVVRTDLTTPASIKRVVSTARKNGLNTLFVQCRGRADAYYCSNLEPRAQCLTKCATDFDPLAQAVRDGHAAGLKVHAWVNSCYVWSDKRAPTASEHLVRANPDWLAVSATGSRCAVGEKEVFICPGNPAARAHLVQVCEDIARRYEVDGVQLDYIRYANQNLCYCDGCLDRFATSLAGTVPEERIKIARAKGRLGLPNTYPGSWRQFRRDQVTTLVREIRTAVKKERPEAMLSVAAIAWGSYPGDFKRSEAYNLVGQDWYGWITSGLVDAVCPMTYQTNTVGFASWVNAVQKTHPDFPIWFGIASYLFNADGSAAKIQTVRHAGGKGWVLFSYTAVTKSGTNDAYLQRLKTLAIPKETASAKR